MSDPLGVVSSTLIQRSGPMLMSLLWELLIIICLCCGSLRKLNADILKADFDDLMVLNFDR